MYAFGQALKTENKESCLISQNVWRMAAVSDSAHGQCSCKSFLQWTRVFKSEFLECFCELGCIFHYDVHFCVLSLSIFSRRLTYIHIFSSMFAFLTPLICCSNLTWECRVFLVIYFRWDFFRKSVSCRMDIGDLFQCQCKELNLGQ
jgi:hypothetical protein